VRGRDASAKPLPLESHGRASPSRANENFRSVSSPAVHLLQRVRKYEVSRSINTVNGHATLAFSDNASFTESWEEGGSVGNVQYTACNETIIYL
jgi:hypothetical protein